MSAERVSLRQKTCVFLIRFQPPLSGFTFMNAGSRDFSNEVLMLGGSMAFQFVHLFAIEASAGFHAGSPRSDFEQSVRLGVTPTLSNGRNAAGIGWVLQWPVLIGYHHMHRFGEYDGYDVSEVTHGVMASTGFEGSRWSSTSFALSYRFLIGATLPVVQHRSTYWNDFVGEGVFRYAVHLTFDVGLAF